MASMPDNLKPTGPTTEMVPEGSRRVCVLNGSRQMDQIIKGEWTTLKVLPENGLSKGVYQLSGTTKASSGRDASFTGQVLFSDSKAVCQLSGKGVVEHPHSAFAKLETKSGKIVGDHSYTVAYMNGKGVASDVQMANIVQPRVTSEGHGASM